jgi:hypothetical protein
MDTNHIEVRRGVGPTSDLTGEKAQWYARVIYSPDRPAAFALCDDVLLETVDFHADGTPDWDEAGECDLIRGEDPALQERIRERLESAAGMRACA